MSKTILKIENLDLAFQVNYRRAWTLRQFILDVITKPKILIEKQKDEILIADSISFEAKEGDRIGLLGLNGMGKTSICRCIAGIYKPNHGKITVNGTIKAVFNTSMGIHPELTGRENLDLLSELIFPEEENKKQLVESAIEFSGLNEFIDAPFRLYSNGMQSRLYLSLISSRPADLFILDEVFEGADHIFSEKVSKQMLGTIKKSGAVLFVSHSVDQVLKVCNKVIVLHHGKILFEGDVKEGLSFYKSLRPNSDRQYDNNWS